MFGGTSGGLFGSQQPQQQSSLFGGTSPTAAGGLFGGSTGLGGNTASQPSFLGNTQGITGSGQIKYRDEKNTEIEGRIQWLTNLPPINITKSIEEIRKEDYNLGLTSLNASTGVRQTLKPSLGGGGLFGSTQQTECGGVFGTQQTTQGTAKGTTSLFGSQQQELFGLLACVFALLGVCLGLLATSLALLAACLALLAACLALLAACLALN
eukprot:GHVP01024763.1.p1 GENE.GHVP01024763.1~~GHVP01024763.1.p1  ORF type:complete len:210 (+),score=50.29 GHVP01024763.1:665-1294(+)